MSDPTTITAQTNTKPNSCVDVQCDCNTMWSMAQQFSTLRLSDSTGDFRARLVRDYAVRARRIAATYARFYLEIEEGGNSKYKGRYYWAALGAFASKTVACTLETWQVRAQANFLSSKTKDGLGKGNLWLFFDVSGWHWYYSKHPHTFETCIDSRNSDHFARAVKAQVTQLPWNAEALEKINRFKSSIHVRTGFSKVRQFEKIRDHDLRPDIQMQHLLSIANHEQDAILQPLIYDDEDFSYWIRLQRSNWINWASPHLELVFSHTCQIEDVQLKSIAPKGTELENFQSRMAWIELAARKFHRLMQEKNGAMEKELALIAEWAEKFDSE